MASHEPTSGWKILALLGVFLVVGVPIVAVLWNAVNEMAAGDLARVIVAVPALILFVVFLLVFARQIRRLEERR